MAKRWYSLETLEDVTLLAKGSARRSFNYDIMLPLVVAAMKLVKTNQLVCNGQESLHSLPYVMEELLRNNIIAMNAVHLASSLHR